MTSDRQIAANRRNALFSTGPRSDPGKAISRRNALTLGLTAEQLLLDGEDPAIFEMLRDELFSEFAPATPYEEQVVHRLVSLVWRLRRIPIFETAILKWIAYRQAVVHDAETASRPTTVLKAREYHGLAAANDRSPGFDRDKLGLGRLLVAEMQQNLTAKLDRRESHLIRQLKATRTELSELQASRATREATERERATPVLPAEPMPVMLTDSSPIEVVDQVTTSSEPIDDSAAPVQSIEPSSN